MSTVVSVDQSIDQGSDFTSDLYRWIDVNGNPVNLVGAAARMKVRPSPDEVSTILISLTLGSGITFNTITGDVSFSVTAAQSLAVPPGAYFYDLFVDLVNGTHRMLIRGALRIIPAVS